MQTKCALLLFLALTFTCCVGSENSSVKSTDSTQESDYSILFVGNSLSFYNNMPAILSEIGKTYGMKIQTKCICKPNYALADHWEDGNLHSTLEQGKFDLVVLQQGPSSQPYGRGLLLQYGKKIKELAEKHDTETAFYMVWPSMTYYHTFDGVIANYTKAAQSTNSKLLPVGEIWKLYYESSRDSLIYDSDFFHPSKKGSFMAAWVIFKTLFPKKEAQETHYFQSYASEADIALFNQYINNRKK